MKRIIFIFSALSIITIASCNKKNEEKIGKETQAYTQPSTPTDTVIVTPTETPKTERPDKPVIETTLNTKLLFNTWVSNPENPHADFVLSKKSFYVVDYDGDADMPYTLNGETLTVYYKDDTRQAKIISVTKDNLLLQWEGVEEPTTYTVWKR
ncbi:hypothetical protein AMR72_07360 [Flavobacterium psychrophilum]|nr:hypothetical protein AMR72_07360 [Flavobacterium psychrophilum]AOE52344.1 hypothetical protein ALW18_07350 [Flavobacterium psychrophilum]